MHVSIIAYGLFLLFVIGVLVPLTVWLVIILRRSMSNSRHVITQNTEILDLTRRSVELHEEAVRIAEESLKKQADLIQILKDVSRSESGYKSAHS
jgi:hypothetical protein